MSARAAALLASPRRVVELGSGTGVVGLALAAAGHDVTLTDTPTVAVPSFDCEGAYEGDYLADSGVMRALRSSTDAAGQTCAPVLVPGRSDCSPGCVKWRTVGGSPARASSSTGTAASFRLIGRFRIYGSDFPTNLTHGTNSAAHCSAACCYSTMFSPVDVPFALGGYLSGRFFVDFPALTLLVAGCLGFVYWTWPATSSVSAGKSTKKRPER